MEYEEHFGSWRCATSQFKEIDAVLASIGVEEEYQEESDEDQEDAEDATCSGLKQCNPSLYEWLMDRIGAPADILIVTVFLVVDALSFAMDEAMWDSKANISCTVVAIYALSLIVSLSITFAFEGSPAVKKIMNPSLLWRFAIAAVFFQVAWRLDADAYMAGTRPIVVKTLGYTYMPVSAIASWVIFRRGYGRLEWLALIIMTLAMAAFCLLRERCRAGSCEGSAYDERWPSTFGISLVFAGVLLSCTASLACERIYKDTSWGLRSIPADEGTDHNRYSIHKVHLDFAGLMFALAVWCCPIRIKRSMWGVPYSPSWFGEWTKFNYAYVPVQVLHFWMAGLVAKRYSTVTKALIQTVATGFVIVLEDPLIAAEKFSQVLVPSFCILIIIVLSALMFQTGRINIAVASASFAADKVMRITVGLREALRDAIIIGKREKRKKSKGGERAGFNLKEVCLKYSIIIIYTLSDATRTMLYTVSVGKSTITPQSFSVAMNGCMLCLSILLLYTQPPKGQSGREALREALRCRKLVKFLPCGFLFALTSALMSMAMGLGISGSLSVVIGKIYLPVCAIASRFLLGKYYMWLEWFAIIILTLDSMAFGFLKDMGAGGRPTNKIAVLACLLSATSSAMSAMVMEKLMKSEPGKPFMIQKLRTDVACFLWSIVFLPIMGWLANPQHFAKGAYWLYRPQTYDCGQYGACGSWSVAGANFSAWDGGGDFAYYGAGDSFVGNATLVTGYLVPTDCACAKGVFAGWGSIMVYLMLVVAVFYGFITGLVVTKFGGVLRAVADNFSLLLVYALGDPLINGTNLDDMALNLTALILPLSSQAFSQAADELKTIQEIKQQHRGYDEDNEEQEEEDPKVLEYATFIEGSSSSDEEEEEEEDED